MEIEQPIRTKELEEFTSHLGFLDYLLTIKKNYNLFNPILMDYQAMIKEINKLNVKIKQANDIRPECKTESDLENITKNPDFFHYAERIEEIEREKIEIAEKERILSKDIASIIKEANKNGIIKNYGNELKKLANLHRTLVQYIQEFSADLTQIV